MIKNISNFLQEFLSADDVEKDKTCPLTPFMAFFGKFFFEIFNFILENYYVYYSHHDHWIVHITKSDSGILLQINLEFSS